MIWGAPGMGKTTVLNQLANKLQDVDSIFFQFEAQSLIGEKNSEFCWQLAKKIGETLTGMDLPFPRIEKPMFLIQPERVFIRDFWNPIVNAAASNSYVFAVDNIEKLVGDLSSHADFARRRRQLWSTLLADSRVRLVLTLSGRPELYTKESLFPMDISLGYQLRKLNFEEAKMLLNYPVSYRVPDYVCRYIFMLTTGHPADTQRIAFSLFDRGTRQSVRQITVADVLFLLSEAYRPSDFYSGVYSNRASITITYSEAEGSFKFVNHP